VINKNIFRNLLAVFIGVLSTGIIALMLYPVVRFIFDKYFHFMGYPRGNEQRDSLIILFTLILWFFVSSTIGGIVCTLFAKNNEWLCVSLNIITLLLLFIIITTGEIFEALDLEGVLILLMIPTGNIAGKFWGSMIKRKRKKNKEDGSPISNSPSF